MDYNKRIVDLYIKITPNKNNFCYQVMGWDKENKANRELSYGFSDDYFMACSKALISLKKLQKEGKQNNE